MDGRYMFSAGPPADHEFGNPHGGQIRAYPPPPPPPPPTAEVPRSYPHHPTMMAMIQQDYPHPGCVREHPYRYPIKRYYSQVAGYAEEVQGPPLTRPYPAYCPTVKMGMNQVKPFPQSMTIGPDVQGHYIDSSSRNEPVPHRKTCKNCNKSKVKCNKASPCSRCVRLNLKCEEIARGRGRPVKAETRKIEAASPISPATEGTASDRSSSQETTEKPIDQGVKTSKLIDMEERELIKLEIPGRSCTRLMTTGSRIKISFVISGEGYLNISREEGNEKEEIHSLVDGVSTTLSRGMKFHFRNRDESRPLIVLLFSS